MAYMCLIDLNEVPLAGREPEMSVLRRMLEGIKGQFGSGTGLTELGAVVPKSR